MRAQQALGLEFVQVAAFVLGTGEHRQHVLARRHALLPQAGRAAVARSTCDAPARRPCWRCSARAPPRQGPATLTGVLIDGHNRQPGLGAGDQRRSGLTGAVQAVVDQRLPAAAGEFDHRPSAARSRRRAGTSAKLAVERRTCRRERPCRRCRCPWPRSPCSAPDLGIGVPTCRRRRWVRQRGLAEQDVRQAFAGRLRQGRQFQPGAGRRSEVIVACPAASAIPSRACRAPAASGPDLRPPAGSGRNGHHADAHLRLRAHRPRRIRSCRPAHRCELAAFLPTLSAQPCNYHRLTRCDLARRLQEALASRGNPRRTAWRRAVLILAEVAQVVVEADVGLVARADIGREADVAVVSASSTSASSMLSDCEMKPMSPGLTLRRSSRFTFLCRLNMPRYSGR